MMLCQFTETDAPDIHLCDVCGVPINSQHPPDRTYRECGRVTEDRSTPCVHLGEQIGLEECKTCVGRVRKKTFACAIHGKCHLTKCKKCGDYQEK